MKQSKTVQAACNLLIDRVQFKTAKFRDPGVVWSTMSQDQYTDQLREATRLYTDTWVVPLLRAIRDGDTYRLQQAVRPFSHGYIEELRNADG